MQYEFCLPVDVLPVGFNYPITYLSFIKEGHSNIYPWDFYYHEDLQFAYDGLRKRYPSRVVIPFAHRVDNDDVACFDAAEISDNPKVVIIHDWASEGWENRGVLENFVDWVSLAKIESQEWKDFFGE